MPSRRRSRSKNLTNNLADVQRRLRFLERRPVRTKLANRVVTRAAIAPNSVSADEAEFGTSIVVPPGEDIDNFKETIENPKEGFLIVDSSNGGSQVYSETQETYYDVSDPVASASADAAAEAAALAAIAAANAQDAADEADAAAAAAQSSATTAFSTAQQAQIDAGAAQTSANGKNAVFRQSSQPTATKIGDIWFHQDDPSGNVGSKGGDTPKRWNGTSWVPFGLNYLAVTSLDANDIVTGTLEAITVRTSLLGLRRIELSNEDDLLFFNNNGQIGVVTGVNASWTNNAQGGYNITEGVMIAAGASSPVQGSATYPSVVVSGGANAANIGAYMFGDADTFIAAEPSSGGAIYTVGSGFYSYADNIILNCGDSNGWYVEVAGPLVLSGQTTIVQGSGAPSGAPSSGQPWTVQFRYT